MTRFVVDAGVVLHLLADDLAVAPGHALVAPTLLRSQVLSALHEAVHQGELDREVALERIARFNRMRIRFLGDAVLREHAWKLADRLGWASTYQAEYLALTLLQADAFVTTDPKLAAVAAGVVRVAPVEALADPDA